MPSRKRIIVAALSLVAVAAAVTIVVRRRQASEKVTYRFTPVARGDVEAVVTATGALSAVSTVQVGTQVSGQISGLYADFNERVKKGQLIARLDPTLLKQAVQSAEAGVTRARADSQQTAFLAQQAKTLYDEAAITQTEYETALYNATVSRANLASAKTDLDRAQQNLRYANIYSPVSGIVIERSVDVGQTVAASLSAPQLFLIAEDLSKMQILVSVDESDIGQVRQGQTVRFTVQAFPNRTFTGAVSQVRMQSTTVQNVVNYTVVVSVSNPDGALLPGMTATTTFEVAKATNVLTVGNAALRFRPTTEMIAALRARLGGSASDTTRRRANGDTARRVAVTGAPGTTPATGAARNGAGAARARGLNGAALWYVDSTGQLAVARVRTGLTDGQVTEISGPAIHEGMQVIAGVTGGTAAATTTTNPFQGGQQNGFRRPGGF